MSAQFVHYKLGMYPLQPSLLTYFDFLSFSGRQQQQQHRHRQASQLRETAAGRQDDQYNNRGQGYTDVQRPAKVNAPGCVNAAGNLGQK